MSFKEELKKEKTDLLKNKRPYETAAFIIFAVLFLQQISILLYRIFDFIKDAADPAISTPWFSTGNITTPGFFARIVTIDSSKAIFLILAFLALILWYGLIYLLVFRYCQKHGYAKWTWTTLVVFGPTIFLIPPYIFFIVFVFRPYFFRFIKRVVSEYKKYDESVPFQEEEENS
ncbi:MAG: hypothetical protein KJ971_04765 [Firmicutes bacterium]|nr:hypothetical protein [Bacillota bacterium]